MKKILSAILAACLLATLLLVLPACSNDDPAPGPGEDSSRGPAQTTAEDTSYLYDENGLLKDSLPADLSYGNANVNILGWQTTRNEFYVEELTEERVNDSIYMRNKNVENRLGVKLAFNLIKGDNANMNAFVTQAEASITAGSSEYDIIGCYSMCSGILAQRGLLCDLYDVEHLDTQKPWWPESFIRSSEINGKLYFATGDISNEFLYNLYFMLVNLDRVKELQLTDPRTMIDSRGWTLDTMISMCQDAYEDLNSSQARDAGDRFGLVVWNQVHIDPFIAASGVQMTRWDNNGNIVLSDEFTGERMVNIVTKLGDMLNNYDGAIYDTKNGYNTIKGGNALFGTVAGSTLTGFREVDWVYGIIPFPIIDAETEKYQSLVGFAYTNFCIPTNASDSSMSGAVIEALASESYRRTSPTLFEVMFKSSYSNDPLDSQMFDLMKSNVYVDMARLYSGNFTWANSAVALFRNSIINGEKSWRAKITSNEKYINGVFADISESFKNQ